MAGQAIVSGVCWIRNTIMSTITIDLTEDLLTHLKDIANQVQISPEILAQAVLTEAMQRPSEEFEQLLEKLLRKNTELYQQLAI